MPQSILRAAVACALASTVFSAAAEAQSPRAAHGGAWAAADSKEGNTRGAAEEAGDVWRQLREQREEIEGLRAILAEQARALEELRARVERAEASAAVPAKAAAVREAVYSAEPVAGGAAASASSTSPAATAKAGETANAQAQASGRADSSARASAPITFSGDMRLRYESIYGQQNALASAEVPGAFGNPLSSRQRLRLRARLAARGRISDEFEWGMRLATGNSADVSSTNQTLTDFFSHKNFSLDQAFISYRPAAVPGLHLQAGKFDAPWWRTEMTWDNDVSPEGLSERYTFRPDGSRLRELSFIAWQLPLLERNAAFVLGPDGRAELAQSRRAGRDLGLYGAQVRAEFAPTETSRLRLAAADHYFAGTHFINPAQFSGSNIQFPVTVNIPASDSTPARTVTGQASVPRDLLVSGNANLGFSTASNNAVNRNGRLASGFNLLDLYGQLELNRRGRWPVMLLINYVKNTQARDFVASGPDGADMLFNNDEDQGYWAEFQVGRDVLRLSPQEVRRGDVVFGYTHIRIEKDAVLTPFNYSDLGRQSDVRAHRLLAAYAADPRVTLLLTGIFSQRPNGLLGPFAETPPGSLNRTLTRLQFDTIFRF